MKITFLGINGSIQSATSGNTSLLVQSEQSAVLVDCSGSPLQTLSCANFDYTKLDALVLTHAHIDHIYALPSLLHNLWLLERKETLAIYAEESTLLFAQSLCALFSLESKKNIFSINWIAIDSKPFQVKDITIHPFDVEHSIPTKGLVFLSDTKKIVYCADTSPLKSFPDFVFDADFLIHECAGLAIHSEKINSAGHTSTKQVAKTANLLRAKKLFLCHLPDSIEEKKEIEAEVKNDSLCPVIIPEVFTPYSL